MSENKTWDEAIASAGFVKLETDVAKKLVITNWRLLEVEKFGEKVIEFQADVLNEDDVDVTKTFTASSKRLKTKLRPILEKKKPTDRVTISILKVGDRFDTQYSVKEVA